MMQSARDHRTEIRDAACLIVSDGCGTDLKLLLGRRHANQVFLPNKWVFPGGRVDPADHDAPSQCLKTANTLLRHDAPTRLRAFAHAGVRELFEETGLALRPAIDVAGNAPVLTPVARAITPPGRIRRYDTWFFAINRSALTGTLSGGDGELLDCAWFDVTAARSLDLPLITRFVLEDAIAAGAGLAGTWPEEVPFYAQGAARYDRRMLALCDL